MNRFGKIAISSFVVFWLLLFNYEALRAFYLQPLAGRSLPKFPVLFPYFGWNMFYSLPNSWSTAEIYGTRDGGQDLERIEADKIFSSRVPGIDFNRRNVIGKVLDPKISGDFCVYLERKFPGYKNFIGFDSFGRGTSFTRTVNFCRGPGVRQTIKHVPAEIRKKDGKFWEFALEQRLQVKRAQGLIIKEKEPDHHETGNCDFPGAFHRLQSYRSLLHE